MQPIYLAHSTLTSLPLRIVAPDHHVALDIYTVWSARMNGGEPPENIEIELLSRNALALEPQLHAAHSPRIQLHRGALQIGMLRGPRAMLHRCCREAPRPTKTG